jgi:uncharacterized protein (TIGR03435 family)
MKASRAALPAMMLLALLASRAWPQIPAASAPERTFEVASIRPSQKTVEPRASVSIQPGGRFVATGTTVKTLIRTAYRLQEFQVISGPDWINTDGFDIVAKAPDGATPDQALLMVGPLLSDRFKLRFRREMRELPIYSLVMAGRDSRLGPQIRVSTTCSIPAVPSNGAASPPPPPPSDDGRGAPPPPVAGQRPSCGLKMSPGRIQAEGITAARLASTLVPLVGRSVADRTGLIGQFDLTLDWAPESNSSAFTASAGRSPTPGLPGPTGSIYTALQEQLGLKLESTRGPVDVLVIDHVERPTPD